VLLVACVSVCRVLPYVNLLNRTYSHIANLTTYLHPLVGYVVPSVNLLDRPIATSLISQHVYIRLSGMWSPL
jgi:hypothetical protein